MRWAFFLAAAACAAGCAPRCPDAVATLDDVVARYNANAAGVPRLWARAKIQITMRDPASGLPVSWGSVSPLAATNGVLLLAKSEKNPLGPHDFVLIGRETAAMELFRMGVSTAEKVYYLWYRFGSRSGAWWGRTALAGAPGIQGLPFDPSQLAAVLGICELPDDFTQPPTVALSMSTDPCAYVVTHIDRQPVTGRLLFKREVYFRWADEGPRRPFLVRFLDAAGRRVMDAKLKDYKPVATGGGAETLMPTNIELTWPARHSRIRLVLSEMSATKTWHRSACEFVDNLPGGIDHSRIVQVDRDVLTKKRTPK